jgi:heptosyltransferase-2
MRRILVIRGGAIGDFIVTLPAVAALRERWPKAHIEHVGYPRIAEIAHRRYYFDGLRSVDSGPLASYFVPRTVLDPDWMEYFGSFDLVLTYFFDPDQIFQQNLRASGVGRLLQGTPKVARAVVPAARHFAQPLAALGIVLSEFAPKIYPNLEDLRAAEAFLAAAGGKPVIALHPGSGGLAKVWPIERWIVLAGTLSDQLPGHGFLLVAGEADRQAAEAFRQAWPASRQPLFIAEGLPLPALAAILFRCRLFLGHDSGISHLAAAAGCRVIALFGPTDPAVWAPQGKQVTVLQRGDVIDAITPEEVTQAVLGALECLRA